jgi:hypothetical protein
LTYVSMLDRLGTDNRFKATFRLEKEQAEIIEDRWNMEVSDLQDILSDALWHYLFCEHVNGHEKERVMSIHRKFQYLESKIRQIENRLRL